MKRSALPFARALCVSLIIAVTSVSQATSECTESTLFGSAITFPTGSTSEYIVTGDFNEDGMLDLAVTNGDYYNDGINASIAVLIGTGNRTFAAPVLYESGTLPFRIVAADFNGDGITDLAAANKLSSNVSVLIGNGTGGVGDGTFAPTVQYFAGDGPIGLVAQDFNRDGITDLATCLNQTTAVSVLPGNGSGGVGDGTFASPIFFPISSISSGLASGDFNGDHIVDLVATEYTQGSVAVLLGTGNAILGSGSFPLALHYAAGVAPFHVEVADLNEDGKQDLMVANIGSGGTSVMFGSGTGGFPSQLVLNSGNTGTVAAGDANQDGIPDLIVGTTTGYNEGVVLVYLGQGSGGVANGSFGPPTEYSTGADAYQIIAGNYDQDDKLDLLVAAGYDYFIALLPGVCSEAPPDTRVPVLTDVRDVPNDQGGRVFLTWTPSSLDVSGGSVNNYRVWRRIPPGQVASARLLASEAHPVIALPGPESSNQVVYWEAVATLPAQRLAGYGYTAATTQDSMRHSNPYTAFFVSALTYDIDVFYSSDVDSGYSVDNIRPRRPNNLVGQPVASGFSLRWDPNDDLDLDGYRLYRGASEDFTASEASLVATPDDNGWVDPQSQGNHYYKLTAIDEHGNESEIAALSPTHPAAVGDLANSRFSLDARPNPSMDGTLRIHFALPSGPGGRLEVIDLAGRKVFSRPLDGWDAGEHAVRLGEDRKLAPGIYLVRLVHGSQSRELKIVMAQ